MRRPADLVLVIKPGALQPREARRHPVLLDRQNFDRDNAIDAGELGARRGAVESREFVQGPGPLGVIGGKDGQEDRRLAGIREQEFKLVLGAKMRQIEEDRDLAAETLAQRRLYMPAERRDPVDALLIRLVVKMRIADENIMQKTGQKGHRGRNLRTRSA